MKKFMNKILTSVLVLALCLLSITLVACGPKDYGENAIVISTYQELKNFLNEFADADHYDELAISNKDKFLVISKNIDCGGEVLTPMLTKDLLGGLNFKIDGDGHTISNFKLDNTCLRDVPSKVGSSSSAFKVLSLFPVAFGGSIENLEFKDVKIELTDYDFAGGRAIQVGIVGVAASNGSVPNNDENASLFNTSSYKNIKVTNLDVDITTVSNADSSDAKKYPFAVGGLIGLDADTTQYGGLLEQDTPKAVRENIKVANVDVNVDFKGGTVLFGGVAGLTNWENVSYKNCDVAGRVNIVNRGEGSAPVYQRPVQGNIVSVGGVCGGTIKGEYGIFVENCDIDIDYTIASQNPNEAVNVGKYLGMVFHKDTMYNELKVDTGNTDTSTKTINTINAAGETTTAGETTAVAQDYILY